MKAERPWSAVWLVAVAAFTAGCDGTRRPAAPQSDAGRASGTPAARAMGAKLLDGAVSTLGRLDDFDETRAVEQAFDRLNQWSRTAPPAAGWQADPLAATLPDRLRSAAPALDRSSFDAAGDVTHLRDRIWLSAIARAARGDAGDDVAVASRLFDWTVRSLALVSDPPMVPSAATPGTRWFMPGEILLSGRASAAQRGWIFLLLAQQCGLDGAMLATGDAASGNLRPWVPAIVSEGQAYLFEPTYGMPVPGPGGVGVATARQAAEDPTVLAGLSLPDKPYPLGPADMTDLTILVAADPWDLSRRMATLDGDLAARHGVHVAVAASHMAAAAAAALPTDSTPVLGVWEFPWETVGRRGAVAAGVEAVVTRELAPLEIAFVAPGPAGRPARTVRPLFAARVREFRGDLEGPEGAKAAYLAARPSRAVLADAVRQLPPEQAENASRLYGRMKEDATYWLGVLTLGEGEYAAAVDYLGRMTLQAAPDSRWTDAARTNLARALIGLGRIDEAVAALRADGSPQRFGSRILADRLERSAAEAVGR